MDQLKQFLLLISVLLCASGCYYKPFIGYATNKSGFKKFSKKERLAGDNENPQRDYAVNRYDWDIEVIPSRKRIEGEMTITFTAHSDQSTFLFDLQKALKIESITSSYGAPKIKRKGDLVFLIFEELVPANTRIELGINYKGKPVNIAGEGPIQWRKDKLDREWISTQTEGVGPHFIMPCNALLGNEPDSCTIQISVPNELQVVANGKLVSKAHSLHEPKTSFKYELTNPINIYNISFNIGHFVKLTKPYKDINGIERELEFQVLDYNSDTASSYYDQTPAIMKFFEETYGAFPWWEDGCKFVESTFSAMEHQSAIAMGSYYKNTWNDYNTTLIHELSHEWWGNSITGQDYCDMWIHEGMATYSEALFLESVYGHDDYLFKMRRNIRSTYNQIPIHKECGVLYNSWASAPDQDIYPKGALTMHSLRTLMQDDETFFKCLKEMQLKYGKSNISTAMFVNFINEFTGTDYSAMFDWYLNKEKPPVLDVYVDNETNSLMYKWNADIPFYPQGKIFVMLGEEPTTLIPTTEYQSLDVSKAKSVSYEIEKSIYYLVNHMDKKP